LGVVAVAFVFGVRGKVFLEPMLVGLDA